MMDTVIRTENLSKHYGKLKAVDNVSISVSHGEIYGFLGLNGAGKTTTIRMLLGMIASTSGAAFLNGVKVTPGNSAMWKDIGYLVEVPYSYPDLTVRENLDIVRHLRMIKDPGCIDLIIEKLDLGQYSDIIAKNLSLGNSQRLGLAKAMMHNPALLLLDEPANGLDPAGIVEIRELLKDLALNKGVTVFISSHILGEISKFATRIGIIHEGVLLHESSVSDMENNRKVCLQVKSKDITGAGNILEKSGFAVVLTDEGVLEIKDKEATSYPEKISALLVNSGFPPSLVKVEEEDLETFFLRVIKMKGGER
jgi:ABC-2 type transport system ATP-binding protein